MVRAGDSGQIHCKFDTAQNQIFFKFDNWFTLYMFLSGFSQPAGGQQKSTQPRRLTLVVLSKHTNFTFPVPRLSNFDLALKVPHVDSLTLPETTRMYFVKH